MFKDDMPGRECTVNDGYTAIIKLKTKFKRGIHIITTDPLESCINSMFNDTEDTMDLKVDDDTEMNDSEVIENIVDDYNGHTNIHSSVDSKHIYTVDDNITKQNSKQRTIPKLSLKDVFVEGREKMIEMNIPSMRERKKLREQRTSDFFLEIHDTVTRGNDNTIEELDKIQNEIFLIHGIVSHTAR